MNPNPYAHVWYAGTKPACFDTDADYQAWRKIAYSVGEIPRQLLACADCTKQFQERMKACGRCENTHISFRGGEPFIYPADLEAAREKIRCAR